MEWRAEAIVLGVRRLGETSVIAEIITRDNGRILGLVRGGRSRERRAVLQPGNTIDAVWRARLDEHLGSLVVEPVTLRAAAIMESPAALHGVQLLAAHLRLLPERDPHPRLFDSLVAFLDAATQGVALGERALRFEVALLEDLGFGLDLETCALTGAHEGLAYVSPRTGRAVTAAAGAPWQDKLLALPGVLTRTDVPEDATTSRELLQGFELTAHFLARDLWLPRGLSEPNVRSAFIASLGLSRPVEAPTHQDA